MDWIETPTAYGFLSHFFLLVGVAVIISLLLRWLAGQSWAAPFGHAPEKLSVYEAAYLSGGPYRVADAVMAGMFRAGQLEVVKPRRLKIVKGPAPTHFASPEYAVYQIAAAAGTVKDARRAVAHGLSNLEHDLADRGLALSAGSRRLWRCMSAAPFALLLIACALRMKIGLDRKEEIGLLIVSSIGLLLITLSLCLVGLRTTANGRRALRSSKRDMRERPLIGGGSTSDWVWTCGLYGVGALPKNEAATLQSALAPTSGSTGSSYDGVSGCSGGSGGSGCGGGGCGGCGGCGG
jgi:uncharacterized protein (TIGR04222 family)